MENFNLNRVWSEQALALLCISYLYLKEYLDRPEFETIAGVILREVKDADRS